MITRWILAASLILQNGLPAPAGATTSPQFHSRVEYCASADVKCLDFTVAPLRAVAQSRRPPDLNINLRGANFRKVRIRMLIAGRDLRYASLQESILAEMAFDGADFTHADMRGLNARSASLINVVLKAADLRGAKLWGANLSGADLTDANLREADLAFANLEGANLRGADLRGAHLLGTRLAGALFDRRTFLPFDEQTARARRMEARE